MPPVAEQPWRRFVCLAVLFSAALTAVGSPPAVAQPNSLSMEASLRAGAPGQTVSLLVNGCSQSVGSRVDTRLERLSDASPSESHLVASFEPDTEELRYSFTVPTIAPGEWELAVYCVPRDPTAKVWGGSLGFRVLSPPPTTTTDASTTTTPTTPTTAPSTSTSSESGSKNDAGPPALAFVIGAFLCAVALAGLVARIRSRTRS